MNEINEIKIPQGVESISVTQHDDKIVIEFIPEERKFKRGDILISIVTPGLTVIFDKITSTITFDSIYNNNLGPNHGWFLDRFRHATKEEEQEFFDELKAEGKRWNAEKLEIEDISQYKFKAGDAVRIKHGVSSKTHRGIPPGFVRDMDNYIGQKLTISKTMQHTKGAHLCKVDENMYEFLEDWLEPWSEEPKKGDLAIFWDYDKDAAIIRFYDKKDYRYHYDSSGTWWKNAIKFESKEQYEKILKGEG